MKLNTAFPDNSMSSSELNLNENGCNQSSLMEIPDNKSTSCVTFPTGCPVLCSNVLRGICINGKTTSDSVKIISGKVIEVMVDLNPPHHILYRVQSEDQQKVGDKVFVATESDLQFAPTASVDVYISQGQMWKEAEIVRSYETFSSAPSSKVLYSVSFMNKEETYPSGVVLVESTNVRYRSTHATTLNTDTKYKDDTPHNGMTTLTEEAGQKEMSRSVCPQEIKFQERRCLPALIKTKSNDSYIQKNSRSIKKNDTCVSLETKNNVANIAATAVRGGCRILSENTTSDALQRIINSHIKAPRKLTEEEVKSLTSFLTEALPRKDNTASIDLVGFVNAIVSLAGEERSVAYIVEQLVKNNMEPDLANRLAIHLSTFLQFMSKENSNDEKNTIWI